MRGKKKGRNGKREKEISSLPHQVGQLGGRGFFLRRGKPKERRKGHFRALGNRLSQGERLATWPGEKEEGMCVRK